MKVSTLVKQACGVRCRPPIMHCFICWSRTPQCAGLVRRKHKRVLNEGGSMKNTSVQFRKQIWQDWQGNQLPVPLAIQKVAGAFVDLQEERHTADYDNHDQWTVTEVQAALNTARSAFQQWQSIRTDPMAGNYLLAMLLSKQRS